MSAGLLRLYVGGDGRVRGRSVVEALIAATTCSLQALAGSFTCGRISSSSHSASTRDRVQQALDVGYEVSIHEAPISQDGWTGAGFAVIDPATGAGG